MGKRWKRLTAFLLVAILLITNAMSVLADGEIESAAIVKEEVLPETSMVEETTEPVGETSESSEPNATPEEAESPVMETPTVEDETTADDMITEESSVVELQPIEEEPSAGTLFDEAEKEEKTTLEKELIEDAETEKESGTEISPGCEYTGDVPSIQMQDTLIGDTQKTIYNPGGANVTDVLGVRREDVLDWLGQHVNDDYYLGTPYYPYDWRSPNGDPSFNGTPGMNCTGFVWHALRMAGANDSTPGLTGWVSMLVNNGMQYVTYTGSNWNDVSGSVAWDGICEPGDIIWTWDMTKGPLQNGVSYHKSAKHHISFFIGTYFDDVKTPGSPYWQEGLVEDRIWHSSDDTA